MTHRRPLLRDSAATDQGPGGQGSGAQGPPRQGSLGSGVHAAAQPSSAGLPEDSPARCPAQRCPALRLGEGHTAVSLPPSPSLPGSPSIITMAMAALCLAPALPAGPRDLAGPAGGCSGWMEVCQHYEPRASGRLWSAPLDLGKPVRALEKASGGFASWPRKQVQVPPDAQPCHQPPGFPEAFS